MSRVVEVKAFKADWPETVHSNAEGARRANIAYLANKVFGAEGDEEPYDAAQFAAARLLIGRLTNDPRNETKNWLEALVKEL